MRMKPKQNKSKQVEQSSSNNKRPNTHKEISKPQRAEILELVLQDKDISAEDISNSKLWKKNFRRYLPVVIDVETGGVDFTRDALLEVAVVMLNYTADGKIANQLSETVHLKPYPGGRLTPQAMAITGIDPDHPFRFALPEAEGLMHIFATIEQGLINSGCQRAVLVGHNAHFDLNFLQAAIERCKLKSPLHRFTCYDTATLAGIYYGETVLAKALAAAGIGFDPKRAHSAIYDAEQTAHLFCKMVNHIHSIALTER